MNKKEKEIEYQKGLTELYEETQEMGRGDFVKMIYGLKEELDIANKKLEKFEWYEMNAETLIESNKILQHEKKDLIKYCENERSIISTQVENTEYGRFIALGEILNKLKGDDK